MRHINKNLFEHPLLWGHQQDTLDRIAFANASPRYAINPVTGAVTGPYAAGTPAIVTIGGERYLQVERAYENTQDRSYDLSYVTANSGLAINTGAQSILTGIPASLITETATTDNHRLFLYGKPSSSGVYVRHIIKKYGSGNRWLRTQGAAATSWFNLQTYQWDTKAPTHSLHFVHALPDGWYDIGYYSSDTGPVAHTFGMSIADNSSAVFLGVITEGVYVAHRENNLSRLYTSSPIITTDVDVTRAKDEAYIPAARVSAALRDKSTIKIYPEYSSAQITTGDKRYPATFADSGANAVGIYLSGTDTKVHLEINGTDAILSGALTWSAGQMLKITPYRTAGTLTVEGATTGNSTETGSAWTAPDGALYLGSDAALANQIDGLVRIGL